MAEVLLTVPHEVNGAGAPLQKRRYEERCSLMPPAVLLDPGSASSSLQ